MEYLRLQKVLKLVNITNTTVKNNLIRISVIPSRNASTAENKEEASFASLEDEDYELTLLEKEEMLEKKRNKSRLNIQHQNIVHGRVPFHEPMDEAHLTLKYKRRIFGRYGLKSNINPGTLWPNAEDIKKVKEYERIAFPYTIQEEISRKKAKIEEEQKAIQERQQKIAENLTKLSQWKKEIEERSAKKRAAFEMAKAKKDALVEEVRRHFGYKVDPREEKFKEMLLAKEKAQKKKLKEERAKAKHEKMMTELISKTT